MVGPQRDKARDGTSDRSTAVLRAGCARLTAVHVSRADDSACASATGDRLDQFPGEHDDHGYIPFAQDAANLFFQLVSSRYEHASLILTSNLPFARRGDVFADRVVAAAMIDRIVHHADGITLKGSSHRLRNTGIDTLPSARTENTSH